jgi:predicted kinase
MTMLIVFAGLPGSGKSTIARGLARGIGALWLRIDSIEQAIRDSGIVSGSIEDAGYRGAYAVAEDNLLLGRDVIGDAVNDCLLARKAWRNVALRTGARVVEIETICTDPEEHRRRIENRASEVPGLILPNWEAVCSRAYEPWDRDHLTIDTAACSVETCIKLIRKMLCV